MTAAANQESPRRTWSPDKRDHFIYRWVKMEGHSQAWVADQLNIDQSTVSRTIHRYERWQAHAAEREGGRLDHAERLRAQRWLTFERNEALLCTCLRIAQEMEGFTDVSKSTVRRPVGKPSQESEVRTEHSVLDRSGVAARFLRLAFRINMEQLKLAELDPPPLPAPLSEEELADLEDSKDTPCAVAADLESSSHTPCATSPTDGVDPELGGIVLATTARQGSHSESCGPAPADDFHPKPQTEPESLTPTSPPRSDRSQSPPQPRSPAPSLHNLHNDSPSEFDLTPIATCTCGTELCTENYAAPCITDRTQLPRYWDEELPEHLELALAARVNPSPSSPSPIALRITGPTADELLGRESR